jgi:hypothetical protein
MGGPDTTLKEGKCSILSICSGDLNKERNALQRQLFAALSGLCAELACRLQRNQKYDAPLRRSYAQQTTESMMVAFLLRASVCEELPVRDDELYHVRQKSPSSAHPPQGHTELLDIQGHT